LLQAKADPNYASANGKLPVHAVLRMKDGRLILQSISALLEAGADPNKIEQRPDKEPMTAFQIAYHENRDDKIYDKLLTCGADPLHGEDQAKGIFSPLHALAINGRYAVLETAYNCGIDIDRPAANGMTCLMLAAKAGAAKTIETLLECNADPTLQDQRGMNAMMYVRSAPPDTDYRPLLKMMSRAAKDHLLRKEVAALRAELDSLRQQVVKTGTA